MNELGEHLTDIAFASDAPLSLCNDANVPQLPVLVKWLVGLDTHAAVQPRLLGTIRNVLLAALLAVAVMCAGYCVGSRVHRQARTYSPRFETCADHLQCIACRWLPAPQRLPPARRRASSMMPSQAPLQPCVVSAPHPHQLRDS